MSLGFDPIALIVSGIALLLTIFEIRRNRSVILRIVKVQGGGMSSIGENNQKLFYHFYIYVENRGRTLHDVNLHLRFRPPNGAGWVTAPIPRRGDLDDKKPISSKGEFAFGMKGYFGFKSYENDRGQMYMLGILEDPVAQEAEVVVSTQGYLAKRFPVGRGWDRAMRRWNEMAFRINRLFDGTVTKKNKKYFKSGNVLPEMPSMWRPLQDFVRCLPKPPPPPQPPVGPVFRPQI